MKHFTYKTTCIVTGKFYFGMHSGSPNDSYFGSGVHLHRSLRKYGRKNHVREVLSFYKTRKELIKAEVSLVTEEILNDPKCMNIAKGGLGGFISHTEQTKVKMRENAAKRPDSHYVKGESHGMFGKTHTPEARARISEWNRKPKKPFSEEHRRKLSEQMTRVNAERRSAKLLSADK